MSKYAEIRNLTDEDREDIWRFAIERSEQLMKVVKRTPGQTVRGIEHRDLQTQRWEYEAQQQARRASND